MISTEGFLRVLHRIVNDRGHDWHGSDLDLIERVTKSMPRRGRLLDEKTTARMIFLMYRGLRPDIGDPLAWRMRAGVWPIHLEAIG